MIFADVALDPYTDHGHDGILNKKNYVLNDETVEILMQQSVLQASNGADFICPSDMMDSTVGNIRLALDQSGYINTGIMAYSAKYASNFYGPFRTAVGSSCRLVGDKKTYQMDFANSHEALKEVSLDIEAGADIVMIKPAMCYLDIIQRVKQTFCHPTFAYQVSGEYSILKTMIDKGIINEGAILESLISIRRAGADSIFTYFAPYLADVLRK